MVWPSKCKDFAVFFGPKSTNFPLHHSMQFAAGRKSTKASDAVGWRGTGEAGVVEQARP